MKNNRMPKGEYKVCRKEINKMLENNINKLRKEGNYYRFKSRRIRFRHYINAFEKRMTFERDKDPDAFIEEMFS